jgi:hypothetical protein
MCVIQRVKNRAAVVVVQIGGIGGEVTEEIVRVIERHDHHDQPAREIDGDDARPWDRDGRPCGIGAHRRVEDSIAATLQLQFSILPA